MSQSGLSSSSWERGGRRKKVFEYIKAANDLRQSYTSQLTTQISNAARDYNDSGYQDTPGSYPDVEIARHGDEEMVLFPSYGRRVSRKKKEMLQQRRDSVSSIDNYHDESDDFDGPDPLNWEEYEIENAIVTVDVRGWMYAPHHGPMTRKNRLMIALARRMSGVPAPSTNSTDNSGQNAEVNSSEKITSKGEDELVNKEMQSMINKAESEADAAWKSTARNNREEGPRRTTTAPLDPSQMTKDELSIANAHLMERLRPFLANPMAEMPVTVFFFNDDLSQSRNVLTDASGHFTVRAALPFVPTHIRVLGSENLSAAKEVRIVEPNGVSLISDIDDTIKHSAIANGAKEIFRNTFVRELSELVVGGVSEWYTEMAKLGVEIHYVSNSPWQLYPLLERFFRMCGLPPGSFHLKQYSGMLQGIFEPTAERKRASLERIMDDFPERKFVLVGDSGEADLEVYTDVVLANPGRILGIFIRDVTTTDHAMFFEKSIDHLQSTAARNNSTGHLPQEEDLDAIANRPTLPPRRPADGSVDDSKSIDNADLIDLHEEEEKPKKPENTNAPPAKPSKPQNLRTASTMSDMTPQRKPAPPAPPARRTTPSKAQGQNQQSEAPDQSKRAPPPPPPRRTNTGTSTLGSQSQSSNSGNNPNSNFNSNPSSTTGPATQRQQQSYPAAAASAAFQYASYASDRIWQSAPTNALRSATSTSSLSVGRASSSNVNSQQNSGRNSPAPYPPVPNKREELWHRRWERASEILEKKGVVLGSWRVGSDVKDVCLWLTQEALKEMQQKSAANRKTG